MSAGGIAIAIHPQLGDTNAAEGPPAPTVYLLDTFTEASPPVDILAHTMNVGPGWTAFGSEFFRVIAGNKIEQEFGVLGGIFSDAGVADGVLRFTADQTAWGALVRLSDGDNWFRCALQSTDQIDIQKCEAGVITTPGTTTGLSLTLPAVIKVTCLGEIITMEIEGQTGSVQVTDAFNKNSTNFGLRTGVEGHTGDNFSVMSA